MPVEVVTGAEQTPRRARYLVPLGLPRRGEILAACVVIAVLAHLLFAQLTMVLAAVLFLTAKVTRWRASWLAVPAAAGLAWTAAAGPRAAAAGFADGPARMARYLGANGHQASHLLHFTAGFAGLASWLPRQLPLALLAGTAEAAAAVWLSWLHTDEWNLPRRRPGLLVAARRAAAVRSIRAGAVVTGDGACLGIMPGTGTRVALSWSEAAGGVSVCGSAERDVLGTSLQLVHAAVRWHKPVIAIDLASDPGLPRRLAAVCAAAGVPLLAFGDAPGCQQACYEPFRLGDPARRASLIAAMVSWDGPGHRYRRSCVAYLEDIFELLDAAPGDPRVPVLDELIHLLNPEAMRGRLEYVPAAYPRRAVLAERTRVSMSVVSAEPATTAGLAAALRELRASASGRWLRPGAELIDLGRAVTERAVVLFRLGGSEQLGRLVGQDLATAAATHPAGAEGNGIVWLYECGLLPRHYVADMIARGRDTGPLVLAATTSPRVAADLSDLVNAVVAHRMDGLVLPLDDGTAVSGLRGGEFLLTVRNPRRLVQRGRLVRARP
jgi:hypothetical protein